MNTIRTPAVPPVCAVHTPALLLSIHPVSGEGPFFVVDGGTSTVAAQAVTQAPDAGNMPFQTVAQSSDVTRAEVRSDLQMARANGDLPANGEIL